MAENAQSNSAPAQPAPKAELKNGKKIPLDKLAERVYQLFIEEARLERERRG